MPPGVRIAGWENHPYDWAWWFVRTQCEGVKIVQPGLVIVGDEPSGGQNRYDIQVKAFDPIAQQWMADRTLMPGQPIQLQNGAIVVIPYTLLDDEADAMLGRGMRPHPDQRPFDCPVVDQAGQPILDQNGRVWKLPNAPRDWFEKFVVDHINRRSSGLAPYEDRTLNIDNRQLTVPWVFMDALCKDFMRRRGDFVAAGWWPELLMQDYGQIRTADGKSIAPPVQGRADALGHNVSVMDGTQQQAARHGIGEHPMTENEMP